MNAQKWLTFRLDETCYCLPVQQVREVSHFLWLSAASL